jgi:hypothetical protein
MCTPVLVGWGCCSLLTVKPYYGICWKLSQPNALGTMAPHVQKAPWVRCNIHVHLDYVGGRSLGEYARKCWDKNIANAAVNSNSCDDKLTQRPYRSSVLGKPSLVGARQLPRTDGNTSCDASEEWDNCT